MAVIKRIGPLSLAKIMGVLYGAIGLILGCIFALFSLIGAGIGAAAGDGDPAWLGAIFGVGAVIFLPLFYGGVAFVMGAIIAALYNLFAGLVGGISIETE